MQSFETLVENAREHGLTVSNLSEVRYGFWQAKMRHGLRENTTTYELGYGKTAAEAVYYAIASAITAMQGDTSLVKASDNPDPLTDDFDPLADDGFDPLAE